jgi:HEAT repeat protein
MAGQARAGSRSSLESLKRRYYLAPEGERILVLDEIRKGGSDEGLMFTVDLLRYPDVKVRREAMDVLKRWGNRGRAAVFRGMEDPEISWLCESIFVELGSEALPFLTEMLENPDQAVRARAAYLLGTLGNSLSVGPLFAKLKDPDRDVRINVIQALCTLGDERSLEGILDLFETEDVGLSDFVLQAAEKFGPKAASPLRTALRVGNPRIRSGAALALGRLRLPGTLPDIVAALDDPSPSVRRSAVKGLDSYHDMSAADGLFRALEDADLEVQDYATTALARLYPESYDAVRGKLGNADPQVRKNSVTILRKMGDPRAVPAIIGSLEDPDPNVRMFAVAALIEFGDPRAIQPLIARLKTDPEIAPLASFAFMEIGKEAVDELLATSGDDSFCLTRNLIVLQMGDKALDSLHERALKGEMTVRFNSIALLGELGRPESLPILSNLLQYGDVGWVTSHALAKIGEPAWETLLRASRGKGFERENALEAIGRLEDPRLHLALIGKLSSEDQLLRKAVSEPLVRAGADVVPLLIEQMAELEGKKFADATEILCRMKDRKALRPISRIMFPEPWVPGFLEPDQHFNLRQAYMVKGNFEPIVARLRREAMGAAGGGIPWDRVAP